MRHFFISLFFLFVVALAYSTAKADTADNARADEVVIYDGEAFKSPLMGQNNMWIEKGRSLGLDIIDAALGAAMLLNEPDKVEKLTKTRAGLQRAKILYPKPGSDFFFCSMKENTLAFVNPVTSPDVIKLCETMSSVAGDVKYVAQVLIHEAAHVAKYLNECKATEIELMSMILSEAGISMVNGYWEKCEGTWYNSVSITR